MPDFEPVMGFVRTNLGQMSTLLLWCGQRKLKPSKEYSDLSKVTTVFVAQVAVKMYAGVLRTRSLS